MAPWDCAIFELRNKNWKVGQQQPPTQPREFGILSFLNSETKVRKLVNNDPITGPIWDFVIFEQRNKSWKIGQPPSPSTRTGEFGILSFFNVQRKVNSTPTHLPTSGHVGFAIYRPTQVNCSMVPLADKSASGNMAHR